MTTDFTLTWCGKVHKADYTCMRHSAYDGKLPEVLLAVLPFCVLLAFILSIAGGAGSPGGALFNQRRIGQGGKVFIIHKSRSMVEDGENKTPVATREGDRRTTRVGKAMRAYRLDEIPQFWNILKGDMSLVGPRPEQFRLHRRHRAGAAQARVRSVLRQALFLLVRRLHCDQDRRDAFRCAVARRHRLSLEHESSPSMPVSYPLHQAMSSR